MSTTQAAARRPQFKPAAVHVAVGAACFFGAIIAFAFGIPMSGQYDTQDVGGFLTVAGMALSLGAAGYTISGAYRLAVNVDMAAAAVYAENTTAPGRRAAHSSEHHGPTSGA